MSSLMIKNLNKIYNPGKNEVHAVKDFNLEIEDGEFVALLGPSGCGKTSTLRMIVGLESITSGSILFDDVEINHLSPEQRNVAMAFESYALYPNFTIFENLAFPLEVKKSVSLLFIFFSLFLNSKYFFIELKLESIRGIYLSLFLLPKTLISFLVILTFIDFKVINSEILIPVPYSNSKINMSLSPSKSFLTFKLSNR